MEFADYEKKLEQQCAEIDALDLAYVRRRTNPLKIIGALPGGHFRAVKVKSEALDFEGTLAGGRAIYFDAKLTKNRARFPFNNVGDDQIEYARRHRQMGALAFLVVYAVETGLEYLLPFDEHGRIAGTNHKRAAGGRSNQRESIPLSDCYQWRFLEGENWYDALARIYGE